MWKRRRAAAPSSTSAAARSRLTLTAGHWTARDAERHARPASGTRRVIVGDLSSAATPIVESPAKIRRTTPNPLMWYDHALTRRDRE